MIKINLLRALKDNAPAGAEKDSSESPISAFFAKLFPPKAEDDFDIDGEGGTGNPIEIGAKILIISLIVGGLYYHESVNIPQLQFQLEEENRKLQELVEYNNKAAAAVEEIKRLKAQKVHIERQILSLDGLSKVRLKYIRALDLIQSNLHEKMWFTELKSRENVIEAAGYSFTESEISQFLEVMGRSIYFSDVSMISSEDVTARDGEARKFKKFNLNFVLEANK